MARGKKQRIEEPSAAPPGPRTKSSAVESPQSKVQSGRGRNPEELRPHGLAFDSRLPTLDVPGDFAGTLFRAIRWVLHLSGRLRPAEVGRQGYVMGIFDLFSKAKIRSGSEQKQDHSVSGGRLESRGKKKPDREFSRLARLVADKMSQNFDRQEAINQLAGMGTSESAAALLKRFGWSMDPSITDQEEKEAAARGIVAAGMQALDPIRTYCSKAESLTWPLKVLRQIVPADQVVEELLTILDEFDTEYVRNVEPKLQLLAVLEEYPNPEVRESVEPFLADISEPVRFAAVTTTFAMNDPAAIPALVTCLADEESLRVRNRISQGLAEHGWEIPADDCEKVRGALPPDFQLRGARIVRMG